MMWWLEVALMVFVVGSALLIPFIDDIVGAIVAFGIVALGVAVMWVLLAAPDIALIEAAVGAGVVSLLFMLTLVKTTGLAKARMETDGGDDDTTRRLTPQNLAIVGFVGIPLLYIVASLDPVGYAGAPAVALETGGELTPYGYYIEQTVEETGFSNSVIAVLVVYRGLDTLGELIVAFAAAVSILIVLGRGDLV